MADVSRNQAATLIANGNVTVNGRHEKASYRALPGDVVVVEPPAPVSREIAGENIPLRVAYEDEFLLVVDKPAGMVVHPAPGNWSGTLWQRRTVRIGYSVRRWRRGGSTVAMRR